VDEAGEAFLLDAREHTHTTAAMDEERHAGLFVPYRCGTTQAIYIFMHMCALILLCLLGNSAYINIINIKRDNMLGSSRLGRCRSCCMVSSSVVVE
jgi:hypothetical protein